MVTMFAPDGARLGEGAVAETEGKTIAIPIVRGFTTDETTAMNSRAAEGSVEMEARIGPVEGPEPDRTCPRGRCARSRPRD